MFEKLERIKLDPTQVLVMGFAAVILVGALLLNLPIASQNGESLGFVDALFTATSAVCVTGLVVVDTGTHFTVFGKVVIAALIQIGGLGFMSMATLLFVLLGKKISLKERLVIQEALNQNSLAGLVRFTLYILLGTFIIEAFGALLLSFSFVPEFGLWRGIGYSVFHSLSAFNNAGFDLIGDGRSLTPYVNDAVINLTIMSLIILGGLGFSVIVDVINNKGLKRLSLHTKMVFLITALLIGLGFVVFLLLEWNNPETLGGLSIKGKLLAALFQSVTPRTAGFNTVNIAGLTNASLLMTIVLMFIGGSPASTAGGIKTSTLGVIIFMVVSVVKGRDDTELFGRRISRSIVQRALTIGILGLFLVLIFTMLLTITETGFSFLEILFETVSAFGTVGLSMGITPELSYIGRLVIIFLMFAGRVGPLTITFALARQQKRNKGMVKYPEDKVLVG